MTLPNKLTVTRILLSPIFIGIFFIPIYLGSNFKILSLIICWVLFIFGEISDVLDGYIARRYKLVSDLGKLMDPFADVVSRLTYFYCFLLAGIMPAWAFYIILLRELLITFTRMVLIKSGTALAASIWGKSKAVVYFISSILAFMYFTFSSVFDDNVRYVFEIVVTGFFTLSALSALASLLDYLYKFSKTDVCKNIIKE